MGEAAEGPDRFLDALRSDRHHVEAGANIDSRLWFDGTGEEAAEFYVSLLPESAIQVASRPAPGKPALVVELSLAGTQYMFLNGGPQYKLLPAASIAVRTADQAETDRLWSALVADGGEESRCGWLTDRFGVSWQIVPGALPRMLGADDGEAAGRAMQAMLQMKNRDRGHTPHAGRRDAQDRLDEPRNARRHLGRL